MHALIIGYGSIGKRHANILRELNCELSIVSSQLISEFRSYKTIDSAFNKNKIDYVIIANQTHQHHATLHQLIQCNFNGIVLVEKPLFSNNNVLLPKHNFKKILVAYNLRFHQLLIYAKQIINEEKLLTVFGYAGKYLPTWRPSLDYRQCYSAHKEQGGGVLRDLSHELDYITWLAGKCISVASTGGLLSDLEISSDDVFSILMKCENCSNINLHINYLDRCSRRELILNTNKKTILIDFVEEKLIINGELKIKCSNEISRTYIKQQEAILDNNFYDFCDFENGTMIVKLIECIEQANVLKKWINL